MRQRKNIEFKINLCQFPCDKKACYFVKKDLIFTRSYEVLYTYFVNGSPENKQTVQQRYSSVFNTYYRYIKKMASYRRCTHYNIPFCALSGIRRQSFRMMYSNLTVFSVVILYFFVILKVRLRKFRIYTLKITRLIFTNHLELNLDNYIR
ncbi:hypothetical protein K501DRAFT_275794 [Backusella circina FSU 941]|nr:hypothetical protein K501DRAFT_275794 [Backusella circina FSU 941]